MSIYSDVAELIDLKNGRIVLNPRAIVSKDASSSMRLEIRDFEEVVYDVAAVASNGVVEFDIKSIIHPIQRVRVLRAGDDRPLVDVANLFPSNNREFEKHFKSHRDRTGDRHLDYFIASQLVHHFTGHEGYRVSAAVTAAYKAIEVMDDSYLEEAESMLRQSLLVIPSVQLARSTRNNREHLHVSVLCALYHVHLAQGKSTEFLETLLLIRELLNKNTFHSYYNLAFNGALSLRLVTLLQVLAEKREEAQITSTLNFQVYKLAARDADENLAHFKELRYVHENAYESMRISRRVKEVNASLVDKTLKACLRVSGDSHPESFRVMRATYLDSVLALRTS